LAALRRLVLRVAIQATQRDGAAGGSDPRLAALRRLVLRVAIRA